MNRSFNPTQLKPQYRNLFWKFMFSLIILPNKKNDRVKRIAVYCKALVFRNGVATGRGVNPLKPMPGIKPFLLKKGDVFLILK